jgi:hypothetical protein
MLGIDRRLVRGEQSVRVSGDFTRDPNAASRLGSPYFTAPTVKPVTNRSTKKL